MKLVIATRNAGKLAEIEAILDGTGIDVVTLAEYPDMPEIVEDGATFFGNAIKKAVEVCAFTGETALADDSGLVVDALDGAPGVQSARFAPTTAERNARLLELMRDVPDSSRTARFVCVLALARPDGFRWSAEGACEGVITREPAGAEGFGYDPVFFYPPLRKTFAEIPREAKNRISHRGLALARFRAAVLDDRILG